jgi:hypothetical protein
MPRSVLIKCVIFLKRPTNALESIRVILLHLNHRLVSAIHVAIFWVVGLFKHYLHWVNAWKMVHIKVQITFHIITKNSNELHGTISS